MTAASLDPELWGDDPFDNPAIAAEMRILQGVRYVCLTVGCDWSGYVAENKKCPRCEDRALYDRWAEHAKRIVP